MTDRDTAPTLLKPVGLEAAEADRYERLRRDLARAVRAVCPAWLADRRDDLVQVAMLRVMAVERQAEGNPELPPSYLYRVANSAVVDEIRARRRRPEVEIEETTVAARRAAPQPAPDQTAHGREIGRGIRACLAAMKDERRQAVSLHLLGHSVPETARLLGEPWKRIENLVYRGLADLRACLESKGLAP